MESNLSDTNICIIRNNNNRGLICMSITICMTEIEVFCSLLNPLKCFDSQNASKLCISKTNIYVACIWYPSWFERAITAGDVAFQNMTVSCHNYIFN